MSLGSRKAAFGAFVGAAKDATAFAAPHGEFSAGGAGEFDGFFFGHDGVATPDTDRHCYRFTKFRG